MSDKDDYIVSVDQEILEEQFKTKDKVTFRYMCPNGFVKEETIKKCDWLLRKEMKKMILAMPVEIQKEWVKDSIMSRVGKEQCEMVGIVDEDDRTATDFDKTIFKPTLDKPKEVA